MEFIGNEATNNLNHFDSLQLVDANIDRSQDLRSGDYDSQNTDNYNSSTSKHFPSSGSN